MCAHVCVCPVCSRALKSGQNALCSLLIVDTPGFQNPRLVKRECSATFEDLCHNYTQERLHALFHQRTFVHELERYKEARMCEILWATHTHTGARIHPRLVSLFLFSLCAVFCFISDISTPIVQILTNQTHHPSHLSRAETSCVHALGLLISDANLHLFSQRSK